MTKFVLQALAMIFMVCDHLSASLLPGPLWLGWVGRLAFPIFAFLLTEGYFHTTNFKGYAKRMFLSSKCTVAVFGGTVLHEGIRSDSIDAGEGRHESNSLRPGNDWKTDAGRRADHLSVPVLFTDHDGLLRFRNPDDPGILRRNEIARNEDPGKGDSCGAGHGGIAGGHVLHQRGDDHGRDPGDSMLRSLL